MWDDDLAAIPFSPFLMTRLKKPVTSSNDQVGKLLLQINLHDLIHSLMCRSNMNEEARSKLYRMQEDAARGKFMRQAVPKL